MPHIIVEYSEALAPTLKQTQLLKQMHETVVASGLFSPEAVKARADAFDDYVLPEGATHFVHITTAILSGRSQQQRAQLSEALFAKAQPLLPEGVKLSVNIHEMDKDTYRK